jgi:hypothetical protein
MMLHVTFAPLTAADMLVASINAHHYAAEAKVLYIVIPVRAYAVSQHATLTGVEPTVGAKLAYALVVVEGSISVRRCAVNQTATLISIGVRVLTVGAMHADAISVQSLDKVGHCPKESSLKLLKSQRDVLHLHLK